jgi:cell division protein FtsZ
MSEFIKNLDVTFEVVSPVKVDFTLLLKAAEAKEVQQPKQLKAKQTVFSLIYRLKSEPVTKVEDEKYY